MLLGERRKPREGCSLSTCALKVQRIQAAFASCGHGLSLHEQLSRWKGILYQASGTLQEIQSSDPKPTYLKP